MKTSKASEKRSLGITLIAAFKFTSGLLLLVVAAGLLKLVHGDVAFQLARMAHVLHADPENRFIHTVIAKVTDIDPTTLKHLSVGSFIYSAVLLTESVGLFLEKVWAEYLTVVATSALLPIEIYEVVERISVVKVVLLLFNALAVAYLARTIRNNRSKASRSHP